MLKSKFLIFYCLGILFSCSDSETGINYLTKEESIVPNEIDGIIYTSGNWQEISYEKPAQSLGNHRAVIETTGDSNIIGVFLPWRRRDIKDDKKRIIVINANTADTVNNMAVHRYTSEFAEIIFEPNGNGNKYHIYYYPYKTTGSYYPVVNYLKPLASASNNWQDKYENLSDTEFNELPKARVTRIESINDFNSFFPMEVAATQAENDSFFSANERAYYLFPEFRNNPAKMTKQLPFFWTTRSYKNGLQDEVKKGEYYTFQIALYAPDKTLNNVDISYSNLSSGRNQIPSSQIACINVDGVDLSGKVFKKKVNVDAGVIQPLWFGIDIPLDVATGIYRGQVIFKPEGLSADTIHLRLDVLNEFVEDHGDSEPAKLSRLRWLNSTLGSEDDFIVKPYLPVEANDHQLKILGREIELDAFGLPKAINSYFKEEMTGLQSNAEPILAQPISFEITVNSKPLSWHSEPYSIITPAVSKASWKTLNQSESLEVQVEGSLEYDGMLQYQITVIAKDEISVDDIKLQIPYAKNAAKYMLGLGFKGSQRPQTIDWKWDITNHHEGVWLGGVNKGLQYVLRDLNYRRPLNTNFYQSQPLNLPPSWYNEGKGGIRIKESRDRVIAENYSGNRELAKGDTLNFIVRFLITPFKPIDTKAHFNTRFVHKYIPVDSVLSYGGTVVNVHHANEINPYINYPFYNLDKQKVYVDEAHSKGIKVKLYNTIRELSYKAYELFPMRSLGYEIYNEGDGGGHPWLQEHLEYDYHKAWHAWRVNDAAILNKGTSRWTNYYIEGLNWLAKNQEIDGLYLDDIAFSRETVKRIVSVFNRHRPEVIIDLHSANQFNPRDGFINSAFLYMEHFPYMTRLWFGEYFEYDLGPNYWLTEVSGIPFGLTGEMLQDGGHPYRGMVYGMTTRVYGKYSPKPIWQLFDDFNIMESEMIGYWVEKVPIKTNNQKVPVTIYRKENAVLLALGSWSDKDELVSLDIDWVGLGVDDPAATRWLVPEVTGLQESRVLKANAPVTIEKDMGLFLIIEFE